MRKVIIAGNWKMNGTKESVRKLITEIKNGVSKIENEKLKWIVFPPFVFLDETEKMLDKTEVAFGAQNMSQNASGAFTGEISAIMLKEFNCQYVLVGHSERRSLYGENDAIVASKFVAAYKENLIPILCVGETLEERKNGTAKEVVERQIDAVIGACDNIDIFTKAIVAYEPVWAIGTGVNATPEEAQEMHAFIRQKFASLNIEVAEKLHVLYGGSLKPDNAKTLLAMPDIDGGLIGGASLKAEDFLNIGKASN